MTSNWTGHNDSMSELIVNFSSVLYHTPSFPPPSSLLHVRGFINRVAIPSLLVFGAVGNAVSLAMLAGRAGCYQRITGRGRGTKLQPLERSAIVGLAALAMSDLFFCLVGVPAVFKPSRGADGPLGMFLLYYTMHRIPLHNLFLFSSTWIAVSVSSERFFAICFPLRARWYLKARYSVAAAILIFVAAALISGPLFFRNHVVLVPCPIQNQCAIVQAGQLFTDPVFRTSYHGLWTALGTFIPLVILLVTSCGLVTVLYRSRTAGIASPDRYPCTRVTATVTAVVITYLLLVCPSTLFEAAALAGLRGSGASYLLAVSIMNLMQAFWFGANFLLYCGCAVGRSSNQSQSVASNSTASAGLLRGRGRRKNDGRLGYQLRETRPVTSSRLITAI